MNQYLYHFRQKRFSLKEGRLLGYQMKTPEIVQKSQEVAKEIVKTAPDEARIDVALNTANASEKQQIIDQVRTNLNAQNLTPALLLVATENLKNLEARIASKAPAAPTVAAPTPDPEKKDPEKNGFMDKAGEMWKESSINPSNWKPETRTKVSAVAAAAGITFVAYYALKGLKSFFFGAKKVKEQAVEKSKGFLKSILIFAGIATVGLLGYAGFKGIQEALMGKLKAELDGLKKKGEELKNALTTATGAKADAIRAELAKQNKRIASLQNKLDGTTPQEPSEDPKPTITDRVQDEAEVAAKIAQERLEVIAMLNLIDTSGWNLEQGAKKSQISDVISDNASLDMVDVFKSVSGDANSPTISITPPFVIRGDEDRENRKKAAEVLLRFCHKYKDQLIQNIAVHENISLDEALEKVEGMNLAEYISEVMQNFSVVVSTMEHMHKMRGSLVNALNSLDVQGFAKKDTGVRTELYAMAKDIAGIEDEDVANLSATKMLQYSLDRAPFGKTVDHAAGVELGPDASAEEKVLSEVFKEIESGDTHKYLIPAFHDVFPTEEGLDTEKLVKRYLVSRMPLDQALRMFIYRRWMDDGNPSGLIMMQMEILKFIADADEGTLGFKIKKYQVIDNIAEKLVGRTEEELAQEWKEAGIETIPIKAFAGVAGVFTFLLEQSAPVAVDFVQENVSLALAFIYEHPKVVGASALLAAELTRARINYLTNPDKIKDGLMTLQSHLSGRNNPIASADNLVRTLLPGMPNHRNVIEAAESYKSIYDAILTIDKSNEAGRIRYNKVYALLRKATNASHSPKAWRVLANTLHAEGFSSAAGSAEKFLKSQGMRNVLYRFRFSVQDSSLVQGNIKKLGMFGFRQYFKMRDATFGRLLAAPELFNQYQKALSIADEAARVAEFGRLLGKGAKVDDFIMIGAKAADLIQVVDSVDDIQRCLVFMDSAEMVKHQTKVLKLLQSGRTLAQLADAGIDIVQLMDAMESVNTSASKQVFAADVIADARRILNSPESVKAAIEAITFMEDETTRITRLKALIQHIDDPSALMRAGVSSADLLKAGMQSDEVIALCLKIDDVGLRQAAMVDLLHAGQVDDLVAAASKAGPEYVDNLKAIVGGVSGLPADVVTKVTAMQAVARSASDVVPAVADFAALPNTWRTSAEFTRVRGQYADEALEAFDAAAKRLSQMGEIPLDRALVLLGDKSVLDVLGNAKQFGGAHIDEAVRLAMVGQKPAQVLIAVQRTAAYVSALGDFATEAMVDKKVLTFITKWDGADPAFISKFVSKLRETATIGKTGTAAMKTAAARATAVLTDSGEMLKMLGSARRLSLLKGFTALAAFEFAALGFDIYAYHEAKARVEESKKRVDSLLSAKNGFTKSVQGDKVEYFHKQTGIRVDGRFIFQSLDEQLAHPEARMWVSAAGSTATAVAFLAPSIAFGPAGIAIAVATLAVHGFSEACEQQDKRDFLVKMPMGVLALLGFNAAVGVDEYEGLAAVSNDMFSDWFNSSEYNDKQKSEIRKRAVLVMFSQELGALSHDYPAIHGEIMGEKDTFEFMREGGDLYSEDFNKVVKPYLTMRMFQMANDGNDSTWKDFSDFKIDTGWFDWTNIDSADVRIAVKESAILYVQHVRERKYRVANESHKTQKNGKTTEVIRSREQIRALAGETTAHTLDAAHLAALGAKMSFGVPVSSLAYKKIDDPTQVERILATARDALDSKSTYSELQKGYQGKYTSKPDTWVTKPRTREMYSESDFALTIPDGLVPNHNGSRTVELWELPYIALTNDAEQDPVLRRNSFNSRVTSLRGRMKAWHNIRAKDSIRAFGQFELGLTQEDKNDLRDLMMLLYQYPEHDPDGSLREMLKQAEDWEAGEADSMTTAGNGRPLDKDHIGMEFPRHLEKYAHWNKEPIWLMPYLIAPESSEENEATRYKEFITRASRLNSSIFSADSDWVDASDQQNFFEYYALLSEFPEFDTEGTLRKSIRSMSQYNWQVPRWGVGSYDEHPRIKEAKAVYAALQENYNHWRTYEYHHFPWNSAESTPTFVSVNTTGTTSQFELASLRKTVKEGHTENISGLVELDVDEHGDWSSENGTLYVHIDGQEEPVQITARKPVTVNQSEVTDQHISGVGTFLCRAHQRRSNRGRVSMHYTWYFKPESSPAEFFVNLKNSKGIDLKGQKIEVVKPVHERTVNLTEHVHAYQLQRDYGVGITVKLKDGRTKTYDPVNWRDLEKELGQYLSIQKSRLSYGSAMLIIPKDRAMLASVTVDYKNTDTDLPGSQYEYTQEVFTYSDIKEQTPLSAEVVSLHEQAVLYLGLTEQSTGVYTREGYEGIYVLQPDGTVFWSGGKLPSGKLGVARTYMDGAFSADSVPILDPAIERVTLWAGSEFNVPRRRYQLTVRDQFTDANVSVILDPDKPIPAEFSKYWDIRSDKSRWFIKPKSSVFGLYTFRDLESGHVCEIKGTAVSDTQLKARLNLIGEYHESRRKEGEAVYEVPQWRHNYKFTPSTDAHLPGKLDPEYIKQWREKEIARRTALLVEVQKLVPSLKMGRSPGEYEDADTTCVYQFTKTGAVLRSWGVHKKGLAYIAPALFVNGAWAEQEDPERAEHEAIVKSNAEVINEAGLSPMRLGEYTDDKTICVYSIARDGVLHRSWGYRKDRFEYIAPAIFINGKWVEQEDPAKELRVQNLAERKQKKLKDIASRYSERSFTMESGDSNTIIAGIAATETVEAKHEELKGTCRLKDGTSFTFTVGADGSLSNEAATHMKVEQHFEEVDGRKILPLLVVQPQGSDVLGIDLQWGSEAYEFVVTHEYLAGSKTEEVEAEGIEVGKPTELLADFDLSMNFLKVTLRDGTTQTIMVANAASIGQPKKMAAYVWDPDAYAKKEFGEKPSDVLKIADEKLVSLVYTEKIVPKPTSFLEPQVIDNSLEITVKNSDVTRVEIEHNGKAYGHEVIAEK